MVKFFCDKRIFMLHGAESGMRGPQMWAIRRRNPQFQRMFQPRGTKRQCLSACKKHLTNLHG